jgi:excisionase family DNA binding protein
MEPLIDSNEAAKLLRIHPKTLQQMARDHKLPAIRIGKFWRFRTSELDAWLRSAVNWPGYAYRPNKEDL